MVDSYTYLWEFEVDAESRAGFEHHYGPNGGWVQLFRRAPGYVDTLLLRDRAVEGRYVTVDRWQSEQAYKAFRAGFAAQYEALDRECERLTSRERFLSAYDQAAP
jgi:heme-degrading monooxygenase HmoA